jgi:antitoxin component YwqK of YwqJK toxin-antitoxin module/tetratricopeptide (TPR) repeat protein
MRYSFPILLFICFASFAQFPISPNKFDENSIRTGNWTILYDSAWKEVHVPDSTIYYRLMRFDKGKPVGKVRDFYRNGFRQWDGYIVSILPDVFDDGENNYYYENGKLHFKKFIVNQQLNGPSLEYSITGKLIAKGQYKNDLIDGLYTIYSEDGSVLHEVRYEKGLRNGKCLAYHTNGKIKGSYFCKNDLLEGIVENFDESGQLIDHSFYTAGKIGGLNEVYFSNGKMKEKINYKDNQLDGSYTEFYESGKTKRSGSYKNGFKDGAWVFYHPNGEVESKGNIVEGNYEGVWHYFYESGKLSSKGAFQANKLEGQWILYYENGQIKEQSGYHLNNLEGASVSYFENGAVKSEGIYLVGGKTNNWKYYFENKALKTEGKYETDKRQGLWKYYFETGEQDAIENYKNGELNGEVINYYITGNAKDKAAYVVGKKSGKVFGFYENGTKKVEATLLDGLYNGEKLTYFENGKIHEITDYVNGVEQGRSETYYDNGNPFLIGTAKDGKAVGVFTAYHKNGSRGAEKELIDGALNGPIVIYDSITHRVSQRGRFFKNEKNGPWVNYDASGKKKSTEYYVLGNKETQIFVQDSIQQLIDREMYPEALNLIPWLEKVTKRDFKDAKGLALPIHMKSKIYAASENYELELVAASEYLKIIAKASPGSTSHKNATHNVAAALHGLGRYDEALKLYNLAIEMERKKGLVESYWSSINNKVYCLFDAKRPEEASTLLESELALARNKYADSSAGWYIRHEAAEYYYDRPDDYARADELYTKLLADLKNSGSLNHKYAYDAYRRLGSISYLKNKVTASTAYYDSAIAYAESNSRTLYPEYFETLSAQYDNYVDLTDSLTAKSRNLLIGNIKVLEESATRYDLIFKMNRILQVYEYKYGSSNQAVAYGEKAEAACSKAKKENSFLHAQLLQTQAWSIYYSDHRNNALSEEKFIRAIAIRKQLYGDQAPDYYDSQLRLGSFYKNIGQYSKAISIINDILPLITSKQDSATLADANRYLGEAFYYISKYKQSIECYQSALTFYNQNEKKYSSEIRSILSYIAKCYTPLKNYIEAKSSATRAYELTVQAEGEKSKAALYKLDDLGLVHESFSVFTEAQKCYQQKADVYKQLGETTSEDYISTMVQLAKIHRGRSEPQKGMNLLRPHLKSIEGKTASPLQLSILGELADDCSALKMYEQEEAYRKKYLKITKLLYGEDANYASSLRDLGEFYRNQNRLDEAEPILTQALNASRLTTYNQTSYSWIFFYSLGLLKGSLEKNKEAEELFLESLSITLKDTVNSPVEYQVSAENLADFYSKMGRYKEAEKVLVRISNFVERTDGKTSYYYKLRGALVQIYYSQSEYEKSKMEANSIIKLVEEEFGANHWLALNLHNNLGNAASATFDFTTAANEYQYCIEGYLRIPKRTDADTYNLSVMHSNLAGAQLNLGRSSDAERSLIECDRLRKISQKPVPLITQIITRKNWAKVYEEKGDHQKAEAVWIELMNSLLRYTHENFYYMSDEEKALFWKAQGNTFRNFQSYAARRAKQNPFIAGAMYNVQLATKAILLSSSNKIRKRILSSSDTVMINMYYQWQHQRDQLAQLYGSPNNSSAHVALVDSVKKKINRLEKELNIAAEDQVEDRGGSLVDWKQVQALLKPNEAAIEIIRFNHFQRYEKDSVIYAALVLTAESKSAPALVILPDGKLLEGRALKFYKNSITARLDDPSSYNSYWAAIQPLVRDKTTIYLSLDGVYNSINLNSLQSPAGEFLVDIKRLILLSNTKDLLAIKGKKVRGFNRGNATLLGFPTYFMGKEKVERKLNSQRAFDPAQLSIENRSGIADLPGTKIEIEKIKELLASHQWRVSTLLDETATENAVKEINQPKLLHIATHGYFMTDTEANTSATSDPMLRAGLLFTGAANFLQDNVNLSGNNGILTAYEASNLNLDNTDLVVLSACETGKGEVQNGEGVYGLQRAFQTAGAKAIIMSLWKVDDAATQELMTAFYENWMNGATKAEAFRQAQLQLKTKYNDPYYWAAFVMMGE